MEPAVIEIAAIDGRNHLQLGVAAGHHRNSRIAGILLLASGIGLEAVFEGDREAHRRAVIELIAYRAVILLRFRHVFNRQRRAGFFQQDILVILDSVPGIGKTAHNCRGLHRKGGTAAGFDDLVILITGCPYSELVFDENTEPGIVLIPEHIVNQALIIRCYGRVDGQRAFGCIFKGHPVPVGGIAAAFPDIGGLAVSRLRMDGHCCTFSGRNPQIGPLSAVVKPEVSFTVPVSNQKRKGRLADCPDAQNIALSGITKAAEIIVRLPVPAERSCYDRFFSLCKRGANLKALGVFQLGDAEPVFTRNRWDKLKTHAVFMLHIRAVQTDGKRVIQMNVRIFLIVCIGGLRHCVFRLVNDLSDQLFCCIVFSLVCEVPFRAGLVRFAGFHFVFFQNVIVFGLLDDGKRLRRFILCLVVRKYRHRE